MPSSSCMQHEGEERFVVEELGIGMIIAVEEVWTLEVLVEVVEEEEEEGTIGIFSNLDVPLTCPIPGLFE